MLFDSFFFFFGHPYLVSLRAPVAQWVKCWPTDLAVLSLSPLEAKFYQLQMGFIAHILPLSSAHCPDMTEMLLKRM